MQEELDINLFVDNLRDKNSIYDNARASCPMCNSDQIRVVVTNQTGDISVLGKEREIFICKECKHQDTAEYGKYDILHNRWLVQSARTFTCNFIINGSNHCITGDDISIFKDGFYIDEDYSLADYVGGGKKTKATNWIAPGAICNIEIATEEKRFG